MKKVKLILLGLLLLTATSFRAQVSINVQFGSPPVWAPVDRVETQYYYLPDIDCYYDVPTANFICIKNGRWFRSTSLPYRYRNYNLRAGNIVYLTDYRGNSPYIFHSKHREKYYNPPRKPENHENENHESHESHENHNNGNEGNHGNGGNEGHGRGKKHRG